MRVLFIEREPPAGGIVYDQIRRIKAFVSAHVISVSVGSRRRPDDDDVTNVFCPPVPKIENLKGWLFKTLAARALKNAARRGPFDLAHAHFAYPDGLAALEIKRRHGLPYVVTGRGDDVLLYPGRNSYLRGAVSETLKNCSAFIGVSQNLVDTAVRLGAEPGRCFFQPNGIPEDIFNLGAEDAGRGKRILFAGTLLPVKNVIVMTKAFLLLCRMRSDTDFVIAGEGPLRPEIERMIFNAGVSDRFRLAGQLPAPALAAEMRESFALCLPSVSEGWPNVIMEAMACGAPAVGAGVGGIPEQIISDDYGFLCDPRSPSDIADKLNLALNKKWDRRKIAERGALFTRDKTAKAIVSIYGTILSDSKQRTGESCAG
jgi:glycosyltransferase involved in cell wall biosynthesis